MPKALRDNRGGRQRGRQRRIDKIGVMFSTWLRIKRKQTHTDLV